MIRFETINKLKLYVSKFKMFFLCKNFKNFGKKSVMLFPMRIRGSEFIEIGRNVFVYDNSRILVYRRCNTSPLLSIGDGANLGRFVHIVAIKKVIIENNVLIADKVYITDNTHEFFDITRPIKYQPLQFKGEVKIGENTWIGENVCIIGASVGKHCVIGANAVVTKDIPDYTIAIGIPARVIKRYNFDEKMWVNCE
jgi:acetyltransferase-like isoleucine patch superfamily enzyme